MSSRYSAARPKRAGEAFARVHHGEREPSSKKVRFDVRNPSALAPDEREDDEILEADVIGVGSGSATKRGAVNIDGYDSDSENETFNARAESRKSAPKGKEPGESVDLADQLDNYNVRLKGEGEGGPANGGDDGDEDMFAAEDDDTGQDDEAAKTRASKAGKKDKEVRFLDSKDIEGQEDASRSGGHIRLDDEFSSDDEDAELEIQEEGVDEEVGAGGLKKHAPKIDAFNMKQEHEEGAFDEAGNFVRKAVDPDAVHDRWMEGVSKKEMKKAAAAQEKRDAELRRQRKEDDTFITSDLLADLITRLDKGETALEALARLAKVQAKTKAKRTPKWKQNKQKADDGAMDLDADKQPQDTEQARAKDAINAITEAADRLLKRDYPDVYDTERELLTREYRNETGEAWQDLPAAGEEPEPAQMWEYRWTDGRDGAPYQGPFDGPTMKAWNDAGYFGELVEFRPAGRDGGWAREATFM